MTLLPGAHPPPQFLKPVPDDVKIVGLLRLLSGNWFQYQEPVVAVPIEQLAPAVPMFRKRLWREVAEGIQDQMRRIQGEYADGTVLRRYDRHVGRNRSINRIERCNERLWLSQRPQR